MRLAFGNPALCAFDGCEVTTKFPYRMVGKLSGLQQCLILTGHLHGGHEKGARFLRHANGFVIDEIAMLEAACPGTQRLFPSFAAPV